MGAVVGADARERACRKLTAICGLPGIDSASVLPVLAVPDHCWHPSAHVSQAHGESRTERRHGENDSGLKQNNSAKENR